MATGGTVAVYRKGSKKNLFSNKNEEISSHEGIECRGRTEMQNILSMCQESSPERVHEIDLHASKLTRIENFEKFTKLRCLDVSCNRIKTIKALEKNVELKELKLYSNTVTKLEGLDKLKELCSVQLQDNKISKLGGGLQNLKKLRNLRLDCNEIVTISVSEITACSKLTSLNVSSNKLTDISFINSLPNLEEFYASHNNLVKIPDLGRCKKLQELDVSYNEVSSIAGIKSLPAIMILRLQQNAVKGLDISGTVSTLEELYISNNHLGSVKQLVLQFPAIEVLDISLNRFDNLDGLCKDLCKCDMLRELNIADNRCYNPTSLDHQNCLKALPHLEVLNGNPVKRPQSSHGKHRPPMRPVSASQMVSTRHLEEQVSASIQEQNSLETMISSKFDVVYNLLKKLPEKNSEKPCPLASQSNPVQHQSSAKQISEQQDTSLHDSVNDNCQPDTNHKSDRSRSLLFNESNSRPGTQDSWRDSPRPSSRCSNRARLKDAISFAEQNFDE